MTDDTPRRRPPDAACPAGKEAAATPELRRKDKQVADEAWLRRFLREAPYGVLAFVDRHGPGVNGNVFVHLPEESALFFHTALRGRTRDAIEGGARVAFTAMEMGRILPADTALEFSVEYASVVIYGTARVVTDEAEAGKALQALLDKYAPHLRPGEDYRPPTTREIERTSVFRIDIEAWTGKRIPTSADADEAFRFPPESGG